MEQLYHKSDYFCPLKASPDPPQADSRSLGQAAAESKVPIGPRTCGISRRIARRSLDRDGLGSAAVPVVRAALRLESMSLQCGLRLPLQRALDPLTARSPRSGGALLARVGPIASAQAGTLACLRQHTGAAADSGRRGNRCRTRRPHALEGQTIRSGGWLGTAANTAASPRTIVLERRPELGRERSVCRCRTVTGARCSLST